MGLEEPQNPLVDMVEEQGTSRRTFVTSTSYHQRPAEEEGEVEEGRRRWKLKKKKEEN